MAHTLRRSIITLTVTAGLALGTAGAAAAQGLTHVDQRRDVSPYNMETDKAAAGTSTMPTTDIWRTVLLHNPNRIITTTKFADLQRTGDMQATLVSVVTNEGVRRDVTVTAQRGAWQGEATMARPNGSEVPCDIQHKIDYGANTVTVSFPRSCVSDPRWVRIGVAAMWMRSGSSKYFVDDALLSGHINEKDIAFSPRLRRG